MCLRVRENEKYIHTYASTQSGKVEPKIFIHCPHTNEPVLKLVALSNSLRWVECQKCRNRFSQKPFEKVKSKPNPSLLRSAVLYGAWNIQRIIMWLVRGEHTASACFACCIHKFPRAVAHNTYYAASSRVYSRQVNKVVKIAQKVLQIKCASVGLHWYLAAQCCFLGVDSLMGSNAASKSCGWLTYHRSVKLTPRYFSLLMNCNL